MKLDNGDAAKIQEILRGLEIARVKAESLFAVLYDESKMRTGNVISDIHEEIVKTEEFLNNICEEEKTEDE